MARPGTWILVTIIQYLSFQNKVLCITKNDAANDNRECFKLPPNTSAIDMFNSVLNAAANNGVLPDLIPMLQGQMLVENPRLTYPQDITTKPLSVVPMTCSQEPIIFSSQPLNTPAMSQNVLVAKPLPCGSNCPSNIVSTTPQTISSSPVPPYNCKSQVAQALPLENYPVCAPNVVRPTPIVLQPQNQCNEINPYFYSQIAEPIPLSDSTNPSNIPPSPSIQIPPPINPCSETLEITSNLMSPCQFQSTAPPKDCQQGTLQISVPASSFPLPKVTVVAASPANTPVSVPQSFYPDYSTNFPYQYPPQPPIVLGGSSKSSLKQLLPIILWSLFNDRGCNGGCCRCCCSCNGGSGNNIPIPYPIPIPVNNPIVNTGCCCNRDCDRDADDDTDRK